MKIARGKMVVIRMNKKIERIRAYVVSIVEQKIKVSRNWFGPFWEQCLREGTKKATKYEVSKEKKERIWNSSLPLMLKVMCHIWHIVVLVQSLLSLFSSFSIMLTHTNQIQVNNWHYGYYFHKWKLYRS